MTIPQLRNSEILDQDIGYQVDHGDVDKILSIMKELEI
jgi:hypothetical protein